MKAFFKRFRYALEGLTFAFSQERNIQIHLFLFLVLVSAGFCFQLSLGEWIAILLCSALVFSLEIANTVLEKLCDLVHSEKHPMVKQIKDMSAGMVLLAAVFSIVIAGIIFIPKIIAFFN